jgi:Ubiquitin C-terminal hydrolase
VVSPWNFKKVLGKFASQFSGYAQHDSHELLSYLLTGLHEDLNKIKSKKYIEMPDVTDKPEEEAASLY